MTGEIVATDWWTIFDKSVAALARLVFDGAPIVRGDGLAVLPPMVEVHEGPALELARVRDLMPRKEKGALEDALEQIRGTRPTINLTKQGGVGRVTGVEIVTADLTMDLELETERRPDHGRRAACRRRRPHPVPVAVPRERQLGGVLQRPPRRHAVHLRHRHRREARAQARGARHDVDDHPRVADRETTSPASSAPTAASSRTAWKAGRAARGHRRT